ncbi:Protein mlo2 [Paramyrothecium foliicola]|nr:Protein mlo2 [Paramyrothecium foliicola]
MSEHPPTDGAPAQGGANGRSNSFSQQSQGSQESQTAAEFIREQELLEADAREALPYSIENCTKILGPLRQNVFACLTCNPPPKKDSDNWVPAGVCYACSVQCHGEHTLVEIFQKRNFSCDCGTTRIPSTSPCTLRTNEKTNTRGGVHSEEPDANNKYNQNFRNRFCGCESDYDPFQQKGTMFQCFGLGTQETGGCGEDWYHPGCVVGMGPKWYEKMSGSSTVKPPADNKPLPTISEDTEDQKELTKSEEAVVDDEDDPPMPPGFPEEDEFEGFLCYKCVEAHPWIKQYAGSSGFLPPVFFQQSVLPVEGTDDVTSKKRKAEDDGEEQVEAKRIKSETREGHDPELPAKDAVVESDPAPVPSDCKLPNLPVPPQGRFSLFFKEDFRDKFCRCSNCFPKLNAHPQLLEEEEVYEPPMSEDGDGAGSQHGGSTAGSGSLLERGESALRNVDRVRAIEGVMAYNHLKEQLKPFFQKFADSGEAIGAEDIKAYFAKLRGDEDAIKEAGEAAASSKDDKDDDHRKEQSGF